MAVETTLRLSEIPNIVATKEAAMNNEHWSTIVSSAREDSLLKRRDPLTRGGDGDWRPRVVSWASNEAPAEMAQIVELCEKATTLPRASCTHCCIR